MSHPVKTCWILTNHYAGIVSQALGLAESLDALLQKNHQTVNFIHKKITLRPFWHFFSPYMTWGKSFCTTKESDALTEPFPDLIIAAGRQSILPALAVKKASHNKTKLIYLQDPVIHRKKFDLIICPSHDKIARRGCLLPENILTMTGTTHRVTQKRIEQEAKGFETLFQNYPSPHIAVFIGGPNKTYRMGENWVSHLIEHLSNLQKQTKGSLLITTSRRTPREVVEQIKRAFLDRLGHTVYLYDPHQEDSKDQNPYFALLYFGAHLLLTCDSVSMVSEACSTTKPVYLLPLEGKDRKFQHFHHDLMQKKRAVWFNGTLNQETLQTPLTDFAHVTEMIQQRFFFKPL